MRKGIIIGLVLLSVIGCMGQTKSGKEKIQELKTMGNQKEIYLAGGCFWGTEHFMKQIRGVTATQVGYANSTVANPTYRQGCSGRTDAAETVKVVYNPAEVGLPLLLDLYFKTIDPTSLNRQGNDQGTQYRTGIYYTDPSDRALISDKVVDIFDAAGIKKPDISILSEDFLLELKGMEHKNIALEVLRKLLNDEIRMRLRRNLTEGKSLMEMLENSINKYHNRVLTAAEVIEDLIRLSKHIVERDEAHKALGLSDFEYAFYTAVADNDSAKELMGKEKLRELAVVLTETIRKNASIDWTIKENVRAKMKVAVKRMLRKYGYPPDMQALATETVLKQAEKIAEELTGSM